MCSDGFSLTSAWVKKKKDKKSLWGPEGFLDLKTGSRVWFCTGSVVRGVFTWKGILGVSG